MSAVFKNSKKLSQLELRKYMNEHKSKQNTKKIDSPLAKYNDQGQLTCVLCKTIVRSEAVWTVHLNAKVHKQNVEAAKKLKERTNNFTTPLKRPLTPPLVSVPEKKIKGILKNSNSTSEVVTVENDLPPSPIDDTDTKHAENPSEKMETEDALPEGFFDDPKLDAKARRQEYKDPIEEEWDKFVKAIKEADSESNAIIAEDQEEATTERQIDEIDEQMNKLSRVLDLEKKKIQITASSESKNSKTIEEHDDEEAGDFDEFLDWRTKKSFK